MTEDDVIQDDFLQLMAEMCEREQLGAINQDLASVVEATRMYGGKSTLTLTLEVTQWKGARSHGDNDAVMVVIRPEVRCKCARAELQPALKFAASGGLLSDEDPRQSRLFDEKQGNIVPIDRRSASSGG